jgi:hypothetical protein
MYTFVGLIPILLMLMVELWSGIAGMTYDHRVKRRVTPGPYWFIIGLQIFFAVIVSIAAYAMELQTLRD